jgi:hypothetical protein
MTDRFRAVLFDWRGTLFHDESDAEWIRASAASIGRSPSTGDADALAKMLGAAADHPEVLAARATADCSAELHRAAVLLELRHKASLGLPRALNNAAIAALIAAATAGKALVDDDCAKKAVAELTRE